MGRAPRPTPGDDSSLSRSSVLKLAGFGITAEPLLGPLDRSTIAWYASDGPTPGALWVVTAPVTLSTSVTVAGVLIEPGGDLIFDPAKSVTLASTRNVIVRGWLPMRPSAAEIQHRLAFSGIQESAFVGGGMVPVDPDVGLWVMGEGVLDLTGTARTAWGRATESLPVGGQSLRLMDHGGRDYCLITTDHAVKGPSLPVLIQDCTFRGYIRAAANIADRRQPGWFRFENSHFEGNEFRVHSTVLAGTRVDVVNPIHGSLRLRRADQQPLRSRIERADVATHVVLPAVAHGPFSSPA